jgi:hypothetical protein
MPTQRDTRPEIPDIVWRGPFGGIQSEQPLDAIEGLGFSDALNVIFRKSNITVRPSYTALPPLPAPANERIVCICDFFNKLGTRVQAVITPTRLLWWNSTTQAWVNITGPGLSGLPNSIFTFSALNYMLAFSQGADGVMLWDGISSSYSVAGAGVVPARFLSEIAFHLILGYTLESGVELPQRVRWSASFDPTDYTSLDSGFVDLTNDLGPITGIANVYQTGFIFQQRGITQVIPTGVGLAPFEFIKISNKAKGNIAPYSLAYYGDQMACYVGKDNIYMFDGVQSYPIGDAPVSGGFARTGARKRIFAELKISDLTQVFGFITSSIAGNDFNAYWLIIPNGSVWVYYFDEGSWTRFVYDQVPSVLGDFSKSGTPEIAQLIGTIAQQVWSPATLVANNPLDDLAIGFTNGTVGDVDYTTYSESNWSITSGNVRSGDSRHNKYTRRMRIVQTDLGSVNYNVSLANEKSQSLVRNVANGSGTGQQLPWLLDENLSGMYMNWKISGGPGMPASFSEIALLQDIAEEFRNT